MKISRRFVSSSSSYADYTQWGVIIRQQTLLGMWGKQRNCVTPGIHPKTRKLSWMFQNKLRNALSSILLPTGAACVCVPADLAGLPRRPRQPRPHARHRRQEAARLLEPGPRVPPGGGGRGPGRDTAASRYLYMDME